PNQNYYPNLDDAIFLGYSGGGPQFSQILEEVEFNYTFSWSGNNTPPHTFFYSNRYNETVDVTAWNLVQDQNVQITYDTGSWYDVGYERPLAIESNNVVIAYGFDSNNELVEYIGT